MVVLVALSWENHALGHSEHSEMVAVKFSYMNIDYFYSMKRTTWTKAVVRSGRQRRKKNEKGIFLGRNSAK